jgi:hypothetical protein
VEPHELSALKFPLGWVLDTAAPPIQYRAITEVAQLELPDAAGFAALPYSYEPAIRLALMQQPDGTWNDAMLTVPSPRASHMQGVGTIPAVQRLLEYGWDAQSPPLLQSRRMLFRLLAADDDPSYLFELARRGKSDLDTVRHGRGILRESAAAALAQAGYGRDPRVRGAARRIVLQLSEYLHSPVSQKPFVRVGNQHVLAPEAAPPSFYTLTMLAHMPLFRSEHYEVMDLLYQYLSQPTPRPVPVSMVGKQIVKQPQLVLGDPLPHRNAADADVPAALVWLEMFARLDFLQRNEGWAKLFERFLDDRDASGVWRPPRRTAVLKTTNPYVWPSFPLEATATGEERLTDVTFRLGLIARLSGREIEVG